MEGAALRDALRDVCADALADALPDSVLEELLHALTLAEGVSEGQMVRVPVGMDGKADADAEGDLLDVDEEEVVDVARAELVKEADDEPLRVLTSDADEAAEFVDEGDDPDESVDVEEGNGERVELGEGVWEDDMTGEREFVFDAVDVREARDERVEEAESDGVALALPGALALGVRMLERDMTADALTTEDTVARVDCDGDRDPRAEVDAHPLELLLADARALSEGDNEPRELTDDEGLVRAVVLLNALTLGLAVVDPVVEELREAEMAAVPLPELVGVTV